MLNFLMGADEGCDTSSLWMWIAIGVIIVLFFAWTFISNRKRGKQMNDMRTTLRVGDEIMTIGGVVGIIVEVRDKSATEKEFVVETGLEGNKSTMAFDVRALGENRTRMREVQAEAARQAEIARQQKEARKMGTAVKSEPEQVKEDTLPQDNTQENNK